jgi:hypothetical protein
MLIHEASVLLVIGNAMRLLRPAGGRAHGTRRPRHPVSGSPDTSERARTTQAA